MVKSVATPSLLYLKKKKKGFYELNYFEEVLYRQKNILYVHEFEPSSALELANDVSSNPTIIADGVPAMTHSSTAEVFHP